jgi:UDP-N-acetyl-2-amino-2-deoxyglucuronate dehydrogenase
LPQGPVFEERKTYRCLTIDERPFEFTDGFANLHTRSYEEILKGNGFGLEDCRPSIEMAYGIRHAVPDPAKGVQHPSAKTVLMKGMPDA